MKWDATEPSRGNFTFGPADQIVNRAPSRGQRCAATRCVARPAAQLGQQHHDANTLRSVMNNHITT